MRFKNASFKAGIGVFVLILLSFSIYIGESSAATCTNQTAGKTQDQLRAELEACNAEIAEWTETLNNTKKNSASYQNDIAALTAKINAAQANIKSKNTAIASLSKDISVKQSKINELDDRMARSRRSLSEILRKTNDIDTYSLVEALLSNKDFSEFFVDMDTYASTEVALEALFDELRGVKKLTESEKAELNKKREAESAAKAALELAKKEVEVNQAEKKVLLADSQNKEKTYAQVLADRQAKAAQIRAVLFPLRDAGAIPFGTALQYAEAASRATGVRPALILAILQQESNLGANVGSCVITDLQSGATKSVNSGTVFLNGIHPLRDLPVMQSLLPSLGRDPLNTKVSCPVSSTFGYGGGMGPAQFIPSTWQLLKSKISSATGKSNPDPWSPSDSIMAMAVYLGDIMGTTGDRTTDERTAACRYYSGRTCYVGGSAGPGLSYGNQVLAKASNIQLTMIDPLQNL